MTIANLGDAKGRIILDASGVQAGIDEARRTFADGMRGIGDSLTDVGKSLSILTAPLMLFGTLGIKAAADFDAAMRELSARTGIVGDDLERMRQAAIEMGETTVFSAVDAANALLQLTSSGLSADEALAVLPAVMYGAAAAGTDLGDTADWVTDILAQFGLSAEDANWVIDTLVKTAGSGSATVQDLALGFQNAGSIAALFGLSVDEVAATLQVFSENGIKGAEAGTQLKSMLTNMTSQTPDTIAAWNELGVSMFDAQGNMRDLDAVIDDLNAAMADMTQEERISYIQRLAGAYGQAGLQALLAAGGTDEMLAAMDGAAGAIDVANARMEGWHGATEGLSGSIETFMINVLTPFMNDKLAPMVNQLAGVVDYINQWALKNPELTSTLVLMLAVLTALGPIMVVLGTIITNTSTVFGAMTATAKLLGAAIGGIGWPVLLVIAAVGALAAAWSTNFLGIRDTVMGVVDEITPKLQAIYDTLKNGDVEGAVGKVGELVESAKSAIETALPDIQAKMSEWTAAFLDWLPPLDELTRELGTLALNIGVWIGDKALEIAGWLLDWANAFLAWIAPQIPTILAELGVLATELLNWIGTEALALAEKLALWAAELVAWIAPQIPLVLAELGALATELLNWAGEQALAIGEKLLEWANAFLAWIAPQIPTILAELGVLATDLLNWIGEQVAVIGEKLLEWAGAFVDWIVPAAADMLLELPGLLADLTKWILDVIPDIVANILLWAAEFVNWIGPVAADMVVALGDVVSAVVNWILSEFVPALIAEAPGMMAALIQFVYEAVTKIPEALGEFLGAVTNWLANDMLPALFNAAIDLGKSILDGIISGLGNLARELARVIDEALPDKVSLGSIHVPDLGPLGGGYDVEVGFDLPANPLQELMGIMDKGGKGLADVPYLIGRGAQPELFIPDSPGTFYPRGQYPEDLLNGGDTYNVFVDVPPILLQQEPQIEDNARLFGERLVAALQAMG